MPLSDAAIRRVKSTEKQQKLSDGGGLFLLVHPNGSRYWRWQYRFGAKGKLLGMGAMAILLASELWGGDFCSASSHGAQVDRSLTLRPSCHWLLC